MFCVYIQLLRDNSLYGSYKRNYDKVESGFLDNFLVKVSPIKNSIR